MEEELNLTEEQKKKFWPYAMWICLVIAIFLLIFFSFRAGGIYACENSGGQLMIDPEYRCYFEEEEQNKIQWEELFKGGENG